MQINRISTTPTQKKQSSSPNFKGLIQIFPRNATESAEALEHLIKAGERLELTSRSVLNGDRYVVLPNLSEILQNLVNLTKKPLAGEPSQAIISTDLLARNSFTENISQIPNQDSMALFIDTQCGKEHPFERMLKNALEGDGIQYKYDNFGKHDKHLLISQIPGYKKLVEYLLSFKKSKM